MNGRGTDSAFAMTRIECDGEENVRGLRSSICNERVVRGSLEVWILQIDVREPVAGRGKADEPAARFYERCDAIYQDEVSEVVGTKLRFETVCGVTERCSHHARVRDDDIEGIARSEEAIGSPALP